MLSKSAARTFFLVGTIVFSAVFLLLTIDTIRRVPAQTNQQNLTEQVVHGKQLWEQNNCMGCHTLLGEGAYYSLSLPRSMRDAGQSSSRRCYAIRRRCIPGSVVW
jgi:nitric oxide reductase subunit C